MFIQKKVLSLLMILGCSSLSCFLAGSVFSSDTQEDLIPDTSSSNLVLSNFSDLAFSEEDFKNAIDIHSGTFVAPSEDATTKFIEEKGLDLIASDQEAFGRVRPCIGLSMDGGGIRGGMSADWLCKLKVAYEEEGEVGLNAQLYQVFDYAGGTSIGGILALGVASDLAPDNMADLFESERNRKRIFSTEGRKLARFFDFFGLFGYRYSSYHLEALLQEQFGETRLNDLKTNILVTACTTDGHPWIFKKEEGYNYKAWEAARCTSAAPTYFADYTPSPYEYPNQPALVDGGIWVNNPSTLVTASIVREFHGGKFNPARLHILSLGTGDVDAHALPHGAGKLQAGTIIEALMHSHSRGNHMMMEQLLGENYYRVNPKMNRVIDLDDTSIGAFTALKSYADRQECKDKIKEFVEKTKEIVRHKLDQE